MRIQTLGNASGLNRRQFLARAAAATGSVPLLQALTADSTSTTASWRPRFSTSSIHFKQLSIERACQRIASLGFEAIDIWSAHENCPHLDDVANRLGPDGLRDLLAKHALKLYAFSTYVGGYARYAELLGKAGGGVAVQGSAPPSAPAELTASMRAFMETLKPLAELAEKHDSWLAIENHGSALLDSVDSFKAFTDLNKSSRVGIALAPFHLQAVGAPVEKVIEICGQQLFFFYAWQNQTGVAQLPGHGPADFKPWLAALRKVNYKWYLNPFMHGAVEVEEMSNALAKAKNTLLKQA